MNHCAKALLFCACLMAAVGNAADNHGVILLYHRVADDGPASTRISPGRFAQHLDWIVDNGFEVVALSRMLNDLYHRGQTVDNAVAITFDDAYVSVYRNAYPALRSRNLPFSVFVATAAVDEGYGSFMSWAQLAEMQADFGAEVGPHSRSHEHLEARRKAEPHSLWLKRVREEIQGSRARLKEALPGPILDVYAYPYGEYSEDTLALVSDLGLRALAQQSGAIGRQTPDNRLPRFAMSEGYGSLERLQTALRARPMPVREPGAQAYVLFPGAAHPTALDLALEGDSLAPAQINCFAANGERLAVMPDGSTARLSLPPLAAGRNKVNCTAPTGDAAGEYYWYSRLWVVADAEGTWLEE